MATFAGHTCVPGCRWLGLAVALGMTVNRLRITREALDGFARELPGAPVVAYTNAARALTHPPSESGEPPADVVVGLVEQAARVRDVVRVVVHFWRAAVDVRERLLTLERRGALRTEIGLSPVFRYRDAERIAEGGNGICCPVGLVTRVHSLDIVARPGHGAARILGRLPEQRSVNDAAIGVQRGEFAWHR